MASARLKDIYNTKIRPELKESLKLKNMMEVPKVSKIILNVGVKEAVSDAKSLQLVVQIMQKIAGQAPMKRLARKSIANFKLREGMPIGVMVTLRGDRMYEFLDKLINLALPKVRDFQGVPTKFDRRGNYNLGVRDWVIFPEADTSAQEKPYGMNVTICTTANNDQHGYELLKSFGMPFRKGK